MWSSTLISSSVTIMDTDADTYQQIANSFQEINGNLTNGNPTTNHAQVPSMITAVDHSQYLLKTWNKLQNTYEVLNINEPV